MTYQKGSMEGVIGVAQRRNPIVGTEIVGNITPAPEPSHSSSSSSSKSSVVGGGGGGNGDCESGGSLTALCTLDGQFIKCIHYYYYEVNVVPFDAGSIKLLKDEVKRWELQVDHSLFSLHCLDITVS